MKKALSIVLSVAMLMTCIFTMFVVPASAEDGIIELMDESYIVEGAENVTINDDGSWTIVGKIGLAVGIEYDYKVYGKIMQDFDSTDGAMIAIYDDKTTAGGNPVYINLYGQWAGPDYYPAGAYCSNDGMDGVYNWCSANAGWVVENNIAKVTSVYIEPAAGGTMTLYNLYLNDGTLKPAEVHLFPENNWEDLWENFNNYIFCTEADPSEWIPTDPANSGNSDIIVSTDEYGVLQLGNTNGGWPSASLELNKKVDYYTSAIDLDLTVLNGARTTLYVFFGDATPTDFEGEGKAYGTILADDLAGHYFGTVMLSDILPEDSDVIDENGMVNVSYIKLYGSSDAPLNPAVTVNWLDLCFYEENPAPADLGDIDLDDDVDTYDALLCMNSALGTITLTEEEYDRADYDRDYEVTLFDALCIFAEASGTNVEDYFQEPII